MRISMQTVYCAIGLLRNKEVAENADWSSHELVSGVQSEAWRFESEVGQTRPRPSGQRRVTYAVSTVLEHRPLSLEIG